MRNIFETAGYKFHWKKKEVLRSGLKCPYCYLTIKKGEIAYIKYNKWLNAISDFCCGNCYKIKVKKGIQ